jgi:prevent-host-death family protein
MTRTISISEIQNSAQAIIDLTRNGDKIVIEENGNPVAKVTPIEPIEKTENLQPRIAGLREGRSWMSDDFDDELPDEFWGFDKEL